MSGTVGDLVREIDAEFDRAIADANQLLAPRGLVLCAAPARAIKSLGARLGARRYLLLEPCQKTVHGGSDV